MIENYIRKRENLVHLFVLIDSRHSPQKIDLDFINKLGEWRKVLLPWYLQKQIKTNPRLLKGM